MHDHDPDLVGRYAACAEELGFERLWSLDSVPGSRTSRVRLLDGLQVLTTAAAATHAIGIGIAVLVLPPRNATLVARELASIDLLSGGRLTVAVGAGRREPTAAGLGLPTGHRGRRLQEGVEVLRVLWADGPAAYHGEFYDFEDLTIEPKPVQRPGPPVWFGGASEPALRRAAEIGDGWLAAGSSRSADFPDQLRVLVEALHEAGRDPGAFGIGKRVYVAVEDSEERARARLTPILDGMYDSPGLTERVAVTGSPETCAEHLRGLVDPGAKELLLNPMYDYLNQLEALATVAALVRDG